jgi:hypothetical protein
VSPFTDQRMSQYQARKKALDAAFEQESRLTFFKNIGTGVLTLLAVGFVLVWPWPSLRSVGWIVFGIVIARWTAEQLIRHELVRTMKRINREFPQPSGNLPK